MGPIARTAAASLSAVCVMGSVARALPADNFNDNTRGPEWTLVQDDASLALAEQNARLEVLASSPTSPNTDALYLSNGPAGFRLSTSSDFAIAIDYNFGSFNGSVVNGALGLVFGIGRDLDGTDSAAIGFGYTNIGIGNFAAVTVGTRTDDVQTTTPIGLGGPSSGTFLISYNAAGDDLTLAVEGSPATTFTLPDTVRTIWGADDLFVSFGARGSGFTTVSGQAYLDNFNVRSGTVVVPEPASLSILALGGGGALLRRGRRRC